jgi:hypothetical protein
VSWDHGGVWCAGSLRQGKEVELRRGRGGKKVESVTEFPKFFEQVHVLEVYDAIDAEFKILSKEKTLGTKNIDISLKK